MEKRWRVAYEGGFYRQRGRGGTEIPVNARFEWGMGRTWHVPAVYACGAGLVVDFCIEISEQRVKAFLRKYKAYIESENEIPLDIQREIEAENPFNMDFRAAFTVNGKSLESSFGSSIMWYSEADLIGNMENTEEAENVLSHYSLDRNKSWLFCRCAFPWATARKPAIKSIKLHLEAEKISIKGISFENPSVGDVIEFTHPTKKTPHTLTVLEYEQQELSEFAFAEGDYDFPRKHWAMVYSINPDIPETEMYIRDTQQNEQPRKIQKYPYAPQSDYSVAMAVIGGADGPTAIFASSAQKENRHISLSALRFEAVSDVKWQMIFREKPIGDIDINLL